MSKITTRAAAAARRKAADVAPEQRTIILKSGRGAVHASNLNTDGQPFPACRDAKALTTPRASRYTETTMPVNCASCNIIIATERTPAPSPRRATAAERTPTGDPYEGKATPRATRARRNGVALAEAEQKATEIISDETAKILGMRDERKATCSDEDYALAVRVRELRAGGRAWWAIAHEMELPGHGATVKQGKTGAAHARRLWERAWGPTYKDTSVERDTKARKVERALTQPGKPFFSADAPDVEVLDAVRGKSLEWTTRLAAGHDTVVCSVQTAIVSPLHKSEIVMGPKGRVLKFYELPEVGSRISGPLRSVYIQQIEKVGL